MLTTTTTNDNLAEFDNHVVYTYIDQWENHSIAKIRLAAREARDELKEILTKFRHEHLELLKQINQQVDTDPNFSTEVCTWTKQLNNLRRDLSKFLAVVHLEQDTSVTPTYMIKLYSKKNKPTNFNKDDEAICVPGSEPLTPAMLIDRPLNEQKQMLGERLFVLVQQIEPNFAAKITGMFLEFEIWHILTLITSPTILKGKIEEARNILQAHRYKQRHEVQS